MTKSIFSRQTHFFLFLVLLIKPLIIASKHFYYSFETFLMAAFTSGEETKCLNFYFLSLPHWHKPEVIKL